MRLPGRCAGCGERVELAMDREDRGGLGSDGRRRFPMAWCEFGTDVTHECIQAKTCSPNMSHPGGRVTSPKKWLGAAQTTPAVLRTSTEGPEMLHSRRGH